MKNFTPKLLAALMIISVLALPGLANPLMGNGVRPEQVVAQVRGFKEVGSYDFSYAMIPLYHAVLLAPGGKYAQGGAYALQMTYKLGLQGSAIANRGLAEMKKQGHDVVEREAWKPALVAMLPAVNSGDTLTAVHTPSGGLVMVQGLAKDGGKISGMTGDSKLAQAFFDIWLGEKTTQPTQRMALLGRQ